MALVRDTAVQKLRDLTIAVALVSTAAVVLIAWVSAATIPGAGGQGQTGNAANTDDQPFTGNDDGFIQGPPPATTGNGPGIVVTGGSHH
jgi:hypothetical protein